MAKKSRYIRVDLGVSESEFVEIAKVGASAEAKRMGWKVKKGSMDHEWADDRNLMVCMDVQVKDEKEARKVLKEAGYDKTDIDDIIYNDFLTDTEREKEE